MAVIKPTASLEAGLNTLPAVDPEIEAREALAASIRETLALVDRLAAEAGDDPGQREVLRQIAQHVRSAKRGLRAHSRERDRRRAIVRRFSVASARIIRRPRTSARRRRSSVRRRAGARCRTGDSGDGSEPSVDAPLLARGAA